MHQDVRFCATPGGRIAYATVGAGPVLLLPTWWVSHLEQDWSSPRFRAFVERLAEHRTVVRYDRVGAGLSDRARDPATLSLDAELATVDALVEHLGIARLSLLGLSSGGAVGIAYAGRRPERVQRLAVIGGYVDGRRITSQAVQDSLVAMVRARWGLGARLLGDVFVGDGDAAAAREFAELQRAGADAGVAADLLALVHRLDATAEAARVRAPTLVVHRRGDRAIPQALGREAAELIPNARLVTLDGSSHVPWYGGSEEVLSILAPFLGLRKEAPAPLAEVPADDLSGREVEVLRLVADGYSDAAIARHLILSPHTVHRHVANIRAKLRQPSRAAAVAHAARAGVL